MTSPPGSRFSTREGPNGRAAQLIHESVHFTYAGPPPPPPPIVDIPEWSGATIGGVTFGVRGEHAGHELVVERAPLVPLAEHDAAVGTAQGQVDVAGVALALVVLRHERDGLPVLGGDLLGGGLVHAVVVGGHQRIGVQEPDLVLTVVALTLRALDVEACGVHVVADVAQQRLDS